MNSTTFVSGLALTALGLLFPVQAQADAWPVPSPNGKVVLTLRTEGEPARARLVYEVTCDGEAILNASPLGIARRDASFVEGLAIVSAGAVEAHDSTYTMLHGKRKQVRDHYNERTIRFQNRDGAPVEVIARAYDDGVAFRYRFPNASPTAHTVIEENTSFQLPPDSRVWAMPFDRPDVYNPAYESYWQDAIPAGTASHTKAGWTFPLLFRTRANQYGLISEAGLDGSYCGSRLATQAPGGLYRLRFPEPGEGNGTGEVEPSHTLPWATPWRVIVVGTSPGVMVETSLIDNLSPPSIFEASGADASWIKPGRVAWSWLFDPDSPQDATKQKEFIDLAAAMGWEHLLVDANWDIMKFGTIHDVIAHAKSKNVGVMLWFNSGGPHNVVTERPRGMMDQKRVRRYELERLAKWGVKGVKIDFFQSDKQNVIQLYHDILRDAADFKIMVNFHGCTLPRGWSRTYPHLMSMEAMRGEENYQFEPKFPSYAPRHNATLPFTRNAVGPMDYTPVMFADNKNPLVVTPGHEIALPVVFESGLLHFAGGPAEYLSLPDAPKRFLQAVPVAWDETRFLTGEPGKFAVIARRSGTTWYIGGINGEGQSREVEIDTKPLGPGPWEAELIEDAATGRSLTSRDAALTSGQPIRLNMRPNGGFAATLRPGR
jgi:hypothetical protein